MMTEERELIKSGSSDMEVFVGGISLWDVDLNPSHMIISLSAHLHVFQMTIPLAAGAWRRPFRLRIIRRIFSSPLIMTR